MVESEAEIAERVGGRIRPKLITLRGEDNFDNTLSRKVCQEQVESRRYFVASGSKCDVTKGLQGVIEPCGEKLDGVGCRQGAEACGRSCVGGRQSMTACDKGFVGADGRQGMTACDKGFVGVKCR